MAKIRGPVVRAVTGVAAAGAGTAATVLVLRAVAAAQDRARNGVDRPPPYDVPPEVRARHDALTVVDLHADSLLWRRDLLTRGDVGHVDVPRLQEANVALVVLDAVTQVPAGLNFERNGPSPDLVTLLSLAQQRPPATLTSRLARALDTAARAAQLAERSGGAVRLIRTRADLDALLADRVHDRSLVGVLLGIEGSHALDGRLDAVAQVAGAGFRTVGLQHFFDNDAGGSAHGLGQGGLTAWGQDLVAALEAAHVVVDLAHSAPAVIDDVLGRASAPLLVSHTGMRGTADNERNLADDHARAIAAGGGLIGIAMFTHAVGPGGVAATARAMRYAADLVGVGHVGLGSDFDGAVRTSVDVTGLPLLTAALADVGFDDAGIAAVMGGNAVEFWRRALV